MEDKLLVSRCKRGDRSALCRIYEKYKRSLLVLTIALLNDKSVAEDVLHDVFVSFAQNIGSFKLKGSLKAYLSTCVANRARNRNRKKGQQHFGVDKAGSVRLYPEEPAHTVIYNEELQRLNHAMSQLPYEQREIIMLHNRSGMRFTTIADSQGISVNTVKSRYRYGIGRLQEMLNEAE